MLYSQVTKVGQRMNSIYPHTKRSFDVLAAGLLLVVLSPIILLTALLVKLDGGPIFFLQDRVGRDEKIFKVIKIRTMIVGAEAMLDKRGRPTGSRITRVGRFLRKSSLDELPQLINVIKGEMSFIGPRPILIRMLPFLTQRERRRFEVRPGITGLAQVKGRNFLRWSRRFRYDEIYVNRMSISLDAHIFFRTLVVLVFNTSGVASETNPDMVDDVTARSSSDSRVEQYGI
jgi:lipopolysaccharide/colanic/teichoic acid biosynthesis glycosyltransferase